MDSNDTLKKALRYLRAEWELYDGIVVPQDNHLSLYDILLSVTMNSRLDTNEKVKSIWKGKAPVEAALSDIPPCLSLTDDGVPWDSLVKLFDASCAIKFVGPAVSTKILHKKRPTLIPIVDNIVSDYLAKRRITPLRSNLSAGERIVEDMKVFREELLAHLPAMTSICAECTLQGFPITPVRAYELLIWVSHEPRRRYQDQDDKKEASL